MVFNNGTMSPSQATLRIKVRPSSSVPNSIKIVLGVLDDTGSGLSFSLSVESYSQERGDADLENKSPSPYNKSSSELPHPASVNNGPTNSPSGPLRRSRRGDSRMHTRSGSVRVSSLSCYVNNK